MKSPIKGHEVTLQITQEFNFKAYVMKQQFTNTLKATCLALIIGAGTLVTASFADDKQEAIEAISNHFKTVPTMTGEFVQFGPNGETNRWKVLNQTSW